MRRSITTVFIGILIASLVGCSAATPTATPAPPPPTTGPATAAPATAVPATAVPATPVPATPAPVTPAPATPTAAPVTAPPLTPVSVQIDFFPGTDYAPLQRGLTKGYFVEQGIELTILPSTGSLATLQAINSNVVQFAFVDSTTYVLQRIQSTTETTALYAYFTFPTFGIWSRTPLNSPADMAGTTFGTVAFSAGRTQLPFILAKNGVDPASVTIELMDFSVLYATLENGDIDSAEAHVPGEEAQFIQAELAGQERYLVTGAEWGLNEYSKLLIARNDMIASNSDLVSRLVAGIDKSMTDALANATDEEIIVVSQELDQLIEPNVATLAWANIKKAATATPGIQRPSVFADGIELVTTSQNLTTDLKPKDLFTNQFIPGYVDLNGLLPDNIRDAGVIKVLTAPVFAPISYYKEGSTTDIIGSDPDILRAMGDRLGVAIAFEATEFPGMLPGVQTGRGDLAGGGLTDTAEREEIVAFVDDFQLGMLYVVKTGNAAGISSDFLSACGKKIAFTTGALSATQVDDLIAKCKEAGMPEPEGVPVSDINDTLLAVRSGRVDVSFYDDFGFDTVNAAANNEMEAFKIEGYPNQYWGFAVNKDDTRFQFALLAALKAIIADGTYADILATYKLEPNALNEPGINLQTGG